MTDPKRIYKIILETGFQVYLLFSTKGPELFGPNSCKPKTPGHNIKLSDIIAVFELTLCMFLRKLVWSKHKILKLSDLRYLRYSVYHERFLAGPMMVSKNFLPLLLKAANNSLSYLSCNRAAIINVSTGLSSVSFCVKNMKHPWYGYICSKAALTMATNIMGRELCNDGILVAAVNPGHVRTNMGGSDAPISVEDCIRKLLWTLASFNENSVGLLHSTNGDVIPW